MVMVVDYLIMMNMITLSKNILKLEIMRFGTIKENKLNKLFKGVLTNSNFNVNIIL